jgi:hypothetical protein
MVKSSHKTSFIQALGFGSCGSKFGQYGRLHIGVSALSRRGFDREAVLIPHSDSDMLQLGLIRKGELHARNEFGLSLGTMVTMEADWDSTGCWAARDNWATPNCYSGHVRRKGKKPSWAGGSFGPWPYSRVKTFSIF